MAVSTTKPATPVHQHDYILAQDIAKKRDYMTTHIYRRTPEVVRFPESTGRPPLTITYLDLVLLDKSQQVDYVEQARRTRDLMRSLKLTENADLLLDGTGVGAAVVDIYREMGLQPTPIVFTSSGEVRYIYATPGTMFSGPAWGKMGIAPLQEIHVPKKDLTHAGAIVLQQRRFRTAPGLKFVDDFRRQLEGFKGKVNEATGHVRYENETDELHDDHVVTFLMAAWWASLQGLDKQDQIIQGDRRAEASGYDPYDYCYDL